MVGDGGEGLIRRIAENFKYFQNLHCSLDSRIIKILLGFRVVFFYFTKNMVLSSYRRVCIFETTRGDNGWRFDQNHRKFSKTPVVGTN